MAYIHKDCNSLMESSPRCHVMEYLGTDLVEQRVGTDSVPSASNFLVL